MRKLVMLDKSGALTEIDTKALWREALALKKYIEKAPIEEEQTFHYQKKLLPLVEQALNNTLEIPYKGSPYNSRLIQEGLEPDLPNAIQFLYYEFIARVHGQPPLYPPGTPVDENGFFVPDMIDENGNHYQWVDFEE